MKKRYNLWILYSSKKGGHRYPSLSIYNTAKQEYENLFNPVVINLLDISPFASFVDSIGRWGDLKLKNVWKKGYGRLNESDPKMLNFYKVGARVIFGRKSVKNILTRIGNTPDVILSIQPEVNVLADLLNYWFACPIHTAIIDYAVHSLWVHKGISQYYIPNHHIEQDMKRYGVELNKIIISGIPIRPSFVSVMETPQRQIRKKLNINEELPTFLLTGGLLGTMVDYAAILNSFMNINTPHQLLVVFGKNDTEKKNLDYMRLKSKFPYYFFGVAENMEELMWASDIVIGKPGSVTMAESLALGKPMIVITPEAGSAQELRFAQFLEKNGAGIWLHSPQEAGITAENILVDYRTFNQMKENARALGKYNRSANKTILENIKNTLRIQYQQQR